MAKSQTMITIDSDLKEYFSKSNINLSGLINEFLRGYKDKDADTISALNYQIKRKELELLSKDHAKLTADLRSLQNEIERYDQAQEQRQIERLRSQKEHQEKLSKCQSCGSSISGPINTKGKNYQLCLNCLNTKSPDELKEYEK